jgi:WD40 repeat protein
MVTERTQAAARGLIVWAEGLREIDVSRSLRLSIAADEMASSSQTRNSLAATLADTSLTATLTGHTSEVNAVAFSPDGHALATGSTDGTVRLWDRLTDPGPPANTATLTGRAGTVWAVVFRPPTREAPPRETPGPAGPTLAIGNGDGTARLWEPASAGQPANIATLIGHEEVIRHAYAVSAVTFSPDGHTLATGRTDGAVRLWDLTDAGTPTPTATLPGDGGAVWGLAFSPDGHTLATGSTHLTVRLWDLTDAGPPTPNATLTGQNGPMWAVAFSPDGHTLATGSTDGAVRLWDLTDAGPSTPAATLPGDGEAVWGLAFSPDGHTLATGSSDGAVRLWDLTNAGRPTNIVAFVGHTDVVNAVAFSPDGHTLASGSDDDTARLWDVRRQVARGGRLRERACAAAGRGLSPEEWAEAVPGIAYRSTCQPR